MDKIKVFHYGCSFSQNFNGFMHLMEDDWKQFDYKNYGKISSGNREIFNRFKEYSEPNSTVILQWSTLTRPMEDNFNIFKTSDNPLYDLLEQWYSILDETQIIAKERNLKLIQFIGWAIWKDSELNEYHREKLKSYGINWFKSEATVDYIASNCFQIQSPPDWSSNVRMDNLYNWPKLEWGGMSEWIREKLDISQRYLGQEPEYGPTSDDPHPSTFGTVRFTKEFLVPKILELNK